MYDYTSTSTSVLALVIIGSMLVIGQDSHHV